MAESTPPLPDISQLTDSQQGVLQTYTSVTDQDPLEAIPILQRAEWNVQFAIARFFDGEPSNDTLAEARATLPAASSRQTTNLEYDSLIAASSASSPRRSPADAVERIDVGSNGEAHYRPPILLDTLLTPFNILFRVLGSALAPFRFLIPTFLARLFARWTTQRPRPTRRPLPPADNARRFVREFEEEYGGKTLPFTESGFNLCLDNAKTDLKFLLVILFSPNHDDNSSWVRQTLLSNQFGSFLTAHQDNTILWGGSVQDAEAYQVSDSLHCTKFPFVALICYSNDAGSTGMTAVMRAVGTLSATELIAKLGAAMTAHEASLNAMRAQRKEQQASRSLREEQDSAYERSLAQDRERVRRRREEVEMLAKAEKEALAQAEMAENRARNADQWRRWRAQSILDEPEGSGKDAARISIRLPSGERIVRRFRVDANIEELYAVVDCHDLLVEPSEKTEAVDKPSGYDHQYAFQLVAPMPRTVYDLEKGGSIGSRIGRGANLIAEPLDLGDEVHGDQ